MQKQVSVGPLLNCPCCDSDEIYFTYWRNDNGLFGKVQCGNCYLTIESGVDVCAERWNRRPAVSGKP